MDMVRAENLIFEYDQRDDDGNVIGSTRAIDGVNIDIPQGSFVAILGHNGSGKSTLAKHLNAILVPTEGTVWVDGMDTKDMDHLWDIRQTAGMVFQNPDNQIIGTVVEEDVGFGPENLGVPTDEIWERVNDSLKAVGMYEHRKDSPNKLSGGQKQRVAIAGVIAMQPKCIVLDEPTAMLDPCGRREVIDAVKALKEKKNVTVIWITHYMEEVIDADQIFVMDDGHIVMHGTPREIFGRADELKGYRMDVPQVTMVAEILRKQGYALPAGIIRREELVREVLSLCGKNGPNVDEAEGANADDDEPKAAGANEDKAGSKAAGANDTEATDLNRAGSAAVSGAEAAAETAEKWEMPPNEAGSADAVNLDTSACEMKQETPANEAGLAASENQETPASPPSRKSIAVEKLNYLYSPGTAYEKHALKDVSFTIPQGQFVGIIGHTGSGKSTLIQHLNGLIRASSGRVLYDGQDIDAEGFDMRMLRTRVGLVFQYPEYQLFEVDVLSDVSFGPKNQGLSKEQSEEQARQALELVGLPEKYYRKSPFELSGGQKRRAAIAGILAMHPEVLILDEPTAGLDPKGRDEILDQVKDLHDKTGMTVVLVSHSMEDVARYVDRLIVMNHGSKMYDGAPREVFSHYRELEKVGLAAPQVTYIMHDLQESGLPAAADAVTAEEAASEISRIITRSRHDS